VIHGSLDGFLEGFVETDVSVGEAPRSPMWFRFGSVSLSHVVLAFSPKI
jgi:hypothetical protein